MKRFVFFPIVQEEVTAGCNERSDMFEPRFLVD